MHACGATAELSSRDALYLSLPCLPHARSAHTNVAVDRVLLGGWGTPGRSGLACSAAPSCRRLADASPRVGVEGGYVSPTNAGLLESGCTDFLRVGPLRRISRRLLGQVGRCSARC